MFITEDGALYQMEWLNAANRPERVVVTRILGPAVP
jgi:hypothetical protein